MSHSCSDRSELLPSNTDTKPPVSPGNPLKQHCETTPSGDSLPQPLKTSDDAKWRVGLHAMDPHVGSKFDGVKLFCAKDAIENAADGEFRWAA